MHRLKHLRTLEGDALKRGARDVRLRRTSRQPDHHAAGLAVPVRGAESHEGGNEIDAAVVGHALGERLDLLGGIEELQAVPEPLHDGAGNEDGALKRILRAFAAELPGGRANQAVLAHAGLASHVHQKEAARAVGILCAAGLKARLTEGRGLLVTRNARHGNRGAEHFGQRLADHA